MDYGYKLSNSEFSLFSWHGTLKDAEARQEQERMRFGRELQIAPMTAEEWEGIREVERSI